MADEIKDGSVKKYIDDNNTAALTYFDDTITAPLGIPADDVQELLDTFIPNLYVAFAAGLAAKKDNSMSTNKLLGRGTAGTGVIEEITLGSGLSLSGTTLNVSGGGGSGDVVGPASATDNAISRFDTGTGKLIQSSSVTIDDDGAITVTGKAGSTYKAKSIEYDTTINQWIAYDNDSNVAMNLGYETWYVCLNNTGSTIPNGSVVYITGASSGSPTIALAKADAAATSVAIGITTEAIANGASGKVTQSGLVNGVNTSSLSAGAVYVSATTAGGLTNTPPTSPNYRMRVGFVGVINASTGTILVTPSTSVLGNGADGESAIISNGVQRYGRPASPYLFNSANYTPTHIRGGAAGQNNNRMWLMPMFFHKRMTLDRIAIAHEATVAGAGSLARLGLYANATTGNDAPDALITDYGTVPLDTAVGTKAITISQIVDPGLYWFAYVNQITSGTPTVSSGSSLLMLPQTPSLTTAFYFNNSVPGTLPSTAGAGQFAGATNGPVIWVRKA